MFFYANVGTSQTRRAVSSRADLSTDRPSIEGNPGFPFTRQTSFTTVRNFNYLQNVATERCAMLPLNSRLKTLGHVTVASPSE